MIRALAFGLKLAVPAIILVILAFRFDLGRAIESASAVALFPLVLAIAMLLSQTAVFAARLSVLVSAFGVPLPFLPSLRLSLEGMFFSQTFISFLGGDAVRIWRVRRRGLSLADSASAIALDRLIGLAVGHFFLVCSLPWLLQALPDAHARVLLLAIAIGGMAVLSMIVLASYLRGRLGMFRRLPEWVKGMAPTTLMLEASTVGRHLFVHPGASFRAASLSILVVMLNSAAFGALLYGMGVEPEIALKCALLLPAVLEVAMLPISFAGWGVREGAAVIAFGALGVSPHIALAASVAFGLISMGVSMLGGIVWLQNKREGNPDEPEPGLREPVVQFREEDIASVSSQSGR